MPISMRSTLFHINVFHYILLSAIAGVKPVFIPHMATMRRLGNALARPEKSLREKLSPSPGSGGAYSAWAVGWEISCWEGAAPRVRVPVALS